MELLQLVIFEENVVSRIIRSGNKVHELMVIDRKDKNFISDHFTELNKPALYILSNREERKLYVGETKDSIKRLRNHEAKDFWTEALVFHSTTSTLSTTEVEWLEAKAYETIKELGYYDLKENKKAPEFPPLKKYQDLDLVPIFDEVKVYVRAAGFDIFWKRDDETGKKPEAKVHHEEAGWKEYYEKGEDAPSKYSLNGGSMLPANQFILSAVKSYCVKHKDATFDKLQAVFPNPKKFGSYGCIRKLEFVERKKYNGHRYFTKAEDILTSGDNVKFVVSTQWSWHNAPAYALYIRSLGFDVEVAFNSKKTNNRESTKANKKVTGSKIECVLKRGELEVKGVFLRDTQKLTVLKGSIIRLEHSQSLKPSPRKRWVTLAKKYTVLKEDKRIVSKNVTFDTPSAAGFFCIGNASNGWDDWHDMDDNKINIYRIK